MLKPTLLSLSTMLLCGNPLVTYERFKSYSLYIILLHKKCKVLITYQSNTLPLFNIIGDSGVRNANYINNYDSNYFYFSIYLFTSCVIA